MRRHSVIKIRTTRKTSFEFTNNKSKISIKSITKLFYKAFSIKGQKDVPILQNLLSGLRKDDYISETKRHLVTRRGKHNNLTHD